MNEGRRGNAAFDVQAYAAQLDAQILAEMQASSVYQSLGAGAPAPVGKYSYSLANYYAKYLGFYDGTITSVTNGNALPCWPCTAVSPVFWPGWPKQWGCRRISKRMPQASG